MTAETTGALPWPELGFHAVRRLVRPVLGVLPDGRRITRRSARSSLTGPPLPATCAAARWLGFRAPALARLDQGGLLRGVRPRARQALEGLETRKLRAVSFTPRLVFDPAIRAGSAAGLRRAASGELTRDAARAANGRPLPEQRRRKAVRALAAVSGGGPAQANRDRAAQHLARGRGGGGGADGRPDPGRVRALAGGGRGQPGGDQPGGRPAQGLAGPAPEPRSTRRPRRRSAGAARPRGTPGGCPRWLRWALPMRRLTCATGTWSGTRRSTRSAPRSASRTTRSSRRSGGTT